MTRAAIYARVSSAAQREAHTIASQLHVLRAFVAARAWELVGEYLDDGRSAKTGQLEKRDGFARLVADAIAGRFDVVVIVDVDRLTRTDSIEERAAILGPFQRAGVRIVSPTAELDLRTMFGQLDVTLRSLYAAEENRKRAERIMAGKARAIAEGRKPAGPTPYGLAYDRSSGTWSLDVAAAAIVREIYARVIAGEACAAIADDLDARGVAFPRRGGSWRRHFVWRIVRVRTYVGEWTAAKASRAIVRVPAIVDEATWQAAQERLLAHGLRGLRKTKHVYLLEGLAVCGHCGSPISIRSPTPGRRPGVINAAAYVCRARKLDQRRAGRCDAPIQRVADVDARVWEIVERALVSPVTVEAIARRFAERDANRRDWAADVQRYQARLDRIDQATAAIMARFRRGAINEAALDLDLAAAAKERAAVTRQLEAARDHAKGPAVPQESAEAWLRALATLAATGSPEGRQRVVRSLVAPGGATFVEREVEVVLEIDEPGTAIVPVMSAGCRTHHETIARPPLRLRLVA